MIKHLFIKKHYIFLAFIFLFNFGCVSNTGDIYEGRKNSGRIENFDPVEIRNRHLDYLKCFKTGKRTGKPSNFKLFEF